MLKRNQILQPKKIEKTHQLTELQSIYSKFSFKLFFIRGRVFYIASKKSLQR